MLSSRIVSAFAIHLLGGSALGEIGSWMLVLMLSDDEFACHTLDHRLQRDGKFKRVYFGHRVSGPLEEFDVLGLTA